MNNHPKGLNLLRIEWKTETMANKSNRKTKNIWYNNRFIRCSTFEKLNLNAKLHLQTFRSFWSIFFHPIDWFILLSLVDIRYTLRFGYFILMIKSIFKIEYNLFNAIHKYIPYVVCSQFHCLSSYVSYDIVYLYVLNKMFI